LLNVEGGCTRSTLKTRWRNHNSFFQGFDCIKHVVILLPLENISRRLIEEFVVPYAGPLNPPILGDSNKRFLLQSPPVLGDLGGECREVRDLLIS
jgi:hypothetical protein